MRIGFCYNVKPKKPSKMGVELDYDAPETIAGIARAIRKCGHEVIRINADMKAFEKLKKLRSKIDLVFNIAEGVDGDARESQIPIFCEMLEIPYTHSSATVHALSLDKNLTKLAVAGLGIRVPGSLLLHEEKVATTDYSRVKFPVIIKPNTEGSSAGVFSDNVVENVPQLKRQLKKLSKMNGWKEMLVEEYIDGREFTVSVWGNDEVEVLPIVEQKFDFLPKGLKKIAGYELKWMYEDNLKDLTKAYDCPPKNLTPKKIGEFNETSKKIYQGLRVKDVCRIDYRMDKKGNIYFIEINTLPGMIPDEDVISYFPLATRKAGYGYVQLVDRLIELAKKRYKLRLK